ncbi:MAG: pirin family protein [Thermoplasmata archaeon]|nr:pirin family protein [Thermoplasmata archaeon]MCI4359515.1 pirin family protein [Thermoplasmata archaeon]
MAHSGGSPRELRVVSSQMDLDDVSGRTLFPSPNQGPWMPFVRVAETTISRQVGVSEGHDHRAEEVLNYVIEGRVEHEDDEGVTSLLEAGMVSLLTARLVGHHNLTAKTPPRARWLSVTVQCPPTAGGPPHLVQRARGPVPTRAGEGCTERHLVGRGGAVASGSGLDCVEFEFGAAGQCVCRVGRERRAVAYVFEGTAWISDQLVDAGAGALLEGVAEVSLRAKAGTRVLLASAPGRSA